MIRIDALWLAVEPIDMRAGSERLLARVVQVFGAAQAHHAYLFANARHTRMKLLIHDGLGVWCAARRLNQGRFAWPAILAGATGAQLTQAQFDALVLGLPWQRTTGIPHAERVCALILDLGEHSLWALKRLARGSVSKSMDSYSSMHSGS